jgi:hypothetical protein
MIKFSFSIVNHDEFIHFALLQRDSSCGLLLIGQQST